jgi:hypothetical protein
VGSEGLTVLDSSLKVIAAVLTKKVHYGEDGEKIDPITKALRDGIISVRRAAALRAELTKKEE